LGYWNIRGLAQQIRYLLKYAGVEFIDKRYEFGEGATLQEPELLLKNWIPDKFNLVFVSQLFPIISTEI
jgi:glutathione S-transferase